MSPSALRAQLDFVRLAAEEPSSLYFEEFLRHGFEAWPSHYQRRFPGLATWRGVAGLKRSLRALAGAPDDWNVLLASRSLALVKLAARRMFHVCRNVLTTDLSWPTYQQVIERHAHHRGAAVTIVPLRDRVLYQHWTTNDVVHNLAAAFVDAGSDGLFLPAVDHLGVRLPIREIVRQIKHRRELRFCFIDAAQAFCQVPIDDCFDVADLVVAGSHKWMGAYLPTGIGYWGRRSRDLGCRNWRGATRASADPQLRFTEQIDAGELDGHSETANLSGLFACAGAAHDQCRLPPLNRCSFDQPDVLDLVPNSLPEWQPLSTCATIRSRIVLLESADERTRRASTAEARRRWLDEGVIVTTYEGGRVRISPPVQFPDRMTAWAERGFATACGTSSRPHR